MDTTTPQTAEPSGLARKSLLYNEPNCLYLLIFCADGLFILAVNNFYLATDDFNNPFVIHGDRLRIFFDNFTCFKGNAVLNAFKYSSVNLSQETFGHKDSVTGE